MQPKIVRTVSSHYFLRSLYNSGCSDAVSPCHFWVCSFVLLKSLPLDNTFLKTWFGGQTDHQYNAHGAYVHVDEDDFSVNLPTATVVPAGLGDLNIDETELVQRYRQEFNETLIGSSLHSPTFEEEMSRPQVEMLEKYRDEFSATLVSTNGGINGDSNSIRFGIFVGAVLDVMLSVCLSRKMCVFV